uniref:Peroxisomal ATPase PEX6 n=1 Tax=Neogobius melanostomus TaxID=47308 RepID=A0A8C6UPA3_9GOBI
MTFGPYRPLELVSTDVLQMFSRCSPELLIKISLSDVMKSLSPQALECRVEVLVSPLSDGSSLLLPRLLLLRLGLFNGQWVRLTTGGGARERLVSVVTADEQEADGQEETGLISTTLWFNLSEGEPVPVSATTLRIKRWCPESPPGRSQTLSAAVSPPFASELHLQPVHSPLYDCSTLNYDRILSEYFTTPRLVCEGDLLSVPVLNHPDLRPSSSVCRSPVLWFKVQSVSSKEEATGGSLADREHTSLFMGVSTNSPAPLVCVGGASLWSLNPPGLSGAVDCVSLCADSFAASEVKMSAILERAEQVRPCVLVLRNLHLLLRASGAEQSRLQAALGRLLHELNTSVVVVASAPRASDLSSSVVPLFLHQVSLSGPEEPQRRDMLRGLTRGLELGPDVDLERLAKLTSGLLLGDLSALVAEATRAARHRLLQATNHCSSAHEEELLLSGVSLQKQDFMAALKALQDAQAQTVAAPKIPSVRWQDVGGLQQVKRQILDTVSLPLTRPELLTLGLERTGLLLYGPPGTGKTLLAKAVATECSMNFLSVKGPELINMYVGQSEENVRQVFARARSAAPCVVFFDELDSLAPSRGRSGDSGGVMDRVVSQLLSELDTLQSTGVFVIGATNRPDLIDQSLLRPGRFDKLVYVGVNEDRESQLQVLQAILRKFDLEPSVDLSAILERCPGHMTGADLYALCCDAMTSAVKRKISLIQQSETNTQTHKHTNTWFLLITQKYVNEPRQHSRHVFNEGMT